MASVNLTGLHVWPPGTTVGLYPQDRWRSGEVPSGTPKGSAVTSGVMSGSGVALTAAAGAYYAAGEVDSKWRYSSVVAGADSPDHQRGTRLLSADDGQPGFRVPRGIVAYTSQAMAANQGRVTRFRPDRAVTINAVSFTVVAAPTAAMPGSIAIYDAGWQRIVTTGALATMVPNSISSPKVSIAATQLQAGEVYYVGISFGTLSGTPSIGVVGLGNAQNAQIAGSAPPAIEADSMNTAHPLPATYVGGGAGLAAPLFFLWEA
jgi:hypothetical protein